MPKTVDDAFIADKAAGDEWKKNACTTQNDPSAMSNM
jgi:hypothetical protein